MAKVIKNRTIRVESDLQGKAFKDLRSYGDYIECFKLESSSDSGYPDCFFATLATGVVLVEFKKNENEEPRELQKKRIAGLISVGVKTFVCGSWEQWVEIKNKVGLSRENVLRAHQEENK